MEQQTKDIAIITGASAGLGVEFARQLRATNPELEIWLIARRENLLQQLASEIGNAHIWPMDLTDRNATQSFRCALQENNPAVKMLINNAGWGQFGKFLEQDADEMLNMIDLNVGAFTWMTSVCLPFMTDGSGIIQVASSAGFVPISRFAVYAATKAYALNFSSVLCQELGENSDITVTTVCPGPVETEFFDRADLRNARLGSPKATAKDVVKKALKDHARGKKISVYGWRIKLFTLLAPLLPRQAAIAITRWVNRNT